jgi:hypothetical protein
MPVFKYINFLCEQTELETRLNEYGAEGWRLHTCEPVATMGEKGSGLLYAFVVLDKMVQPEEQKIAAQFPSDIEGLEMKG